MLTPIEYLVHDDVTIRLCPKFTSAIGDKPEYWYVKKPMYSWDADEWYSREEIKMLMSQGYKVWYWSDGWEPVTPRQFATAEEALLAYETWRASEGKS